jgi:hypothetical protein
MSGQKQRHGIITGGTWCADHNKLVERWPNEEELVEIMAPLVILALISNGLILKYQLQLLGYLETIPMVIYCYSKQNLKD